MTRRVRPGVLLLRSLLSFLLEIGALIALGVAAFHLLPHESAVPVAIAALVVLVLAWGRWMAPRAAHRVGRPARPLLAAGFFLLAAALLVLSGVWWQGLLMAVGAVVLFVLEQLGVGPDEERRVRAVRHPSGPRQRPGRPRAATPESARRESSPSESSRPEPQRPESHQRPEAPG
ncbi:YrdB family protein [Tersicoccus sp. Bi-70]|uniref:YrdB family protein n=1 Tax=Tersicoccus sp. Bi-70 TaxID=1897634 RepID=UPI00117E64CC|nr:YrdB family protein [Tersicoccus sp. Bi-70]